MKLQIQPDILLDESHRDELIAERGRTTVPVLRITSPDGGERWMPLNGVRMPHSRLLLCIGLRGSEGQSHCLEARSDAIMRSNAGRIWPSGGRDMSRLRDERAISVLRAIACVGVYAGLLVPAVYVPVVFFPSVFPKIIFLQFTIGLTFPAYLCLAWLEPRFRPPRSAIYAAILFHIAAVTVSTVLSVDSHQSWWGGQERMGGQFGLLHFVAWLTMTIGLFKRWEEWSRLLRFEVVVAVIMAIVALLQIPYPDLLGFHSDRRVSGFLGNPIFMAGYQLFNLSFIALLFVKTTEKRERIWYSAALALCFASLLAAQSRGAMVGLAAVTVSFGLYYALKSENKRAVRGSLYGIASILAVLALPFVFRTSSIVASSDALSRIVNFSDALSTRMIVWSMAWQGILKRPFTGWGYDTFHIVANREYDPKLLEYGYDDTWFDRAHNIVMDTLVTTGALGLFAMFLLLAVTLLLLSRAQAKGWIDLPTAAILISMPIGYFVQNLSTFDHPAEMSMIYLMFSLAISGSTA